MYCSIIKENITHPPPAMATKFYRYVYGRQNYNRYNRDLMLANDCSIQNQRKTIQQQIAAWREWERQYVINRENGLPPPPRPPPIGFDEVVNDKTQEEIDACKLAYTALHQKQLLSPNANIQSTNMRIGYWLTHQNRLPILTAWY